MTVLVALAALIVSIWASRRAARKLEFELLLEPIDRGAAKREDAIRTLMDRSDRRFEALQKRSNELYRQSKEITARVTHAGTVLETAAAPASATGQSEAVAAQDVLGGPPSD